MTFARCDTCGQVFTPDFVEVPLSGGGIRQEFTCPHCRHTYRVFALTARGVDLREQMRRLRARRERTGRLVPPHEWRRLVEQYERELTPLSKR